MIAVVIPVYNHAEALDRCLSSLFGQTLRPDFIIVIDDGSTLGDPEPVLKKWHQALPLKFVRQENSGAPAARNKGFSVILEEQSDDRIPSGSGDPIGRTPASLQDDMVIFCDADVVMNSDCLEKMKRALDENPGASYAYSSFKFGFKVFKCGPFDADRLRQMPYITTTCLVRTADFPGFDESLKKFQDWDLWLTMLDQGKVGVWIPEVLFSAKPRKGGMSTWIPSFMHKIPWPILGWTPKEIIKYRTREEIIRQKHAL